MKNSKAKKKSKFLYYFVKVTGGLPIMLWYRPKKIFLGKGEFPKIKGKLICSNHERPMDAIVIQCVFWNKTLSFLAMEELLDTKLKRFFFTNTGCIPVDRSNFSLDSMHLVFDELKKGYNVLIFPEGRLNLEHEEDVMQFKGGVALMAYLSKAPVIPMYLYPRKKWYQRSVALIGDPINVSEICKAPSMQEMDMAGQKIREKVLELRDTYDKLKEKK